MVGVPGRSKGCETCRKRKKACDLKRPICGQCLRLNLKCGGYDRRLIFVPYQSGTVEEAPVAQIDSALGYSPRTLQRSAHEEQLFCHLWEEVFRRSSASLQLVPTNTVEKQPPWLHMLDWSNSVEQMYRQDSVVKSALLALSLSCYGRQYKKQAVLVEGTHQYSRALALISRALRDDRMTSDEVLAACKLFVVYEWFGFGAYEGPTKLAINWNLHTLGCATLLQARGPRGFETDRSYWLFAGIRYMVVINSIRARKKTFLSDPEWIVLPWTNRPKDVHQKLLDIAVELPTVLEEFDMVKNGACQQEDRRDLYQRLISRSWHLEMALRRWYSSLVLKLQPGTIDKIKNGIPEDFPPEGVALASSIVNYWCIVVCLYNTLRLVYERTALEFPDIASGDLPTFVNPHHYAVAISNSTAYFFSPGVGALGPWAFCMPMGFALAYFDFCCPEAVAECNQLLEGFKTDMGLIVKRFLVSAQAEGWRRGEKHFACPPGVVKPWHETHGHALQESIIP